MKSFTLIRRLAVLTGLLAISASIHAADSSWTNTAGGSFGDAGNWDNGVPGSTDLATFGQGSSTYTVNFDSGNVTNRQVLVTNSNQDVTWDLGGNLYRIANGYASGNHAILAFTNLTDSGTLTIQNGTVQADYGGYGIGFYAPRGTIIVTNGGSVIGTSTGIQNLIIDGVGSSWSSYDYTYMNNVIVRNGAGVQVFRGGVIQNLYVDNAVVTNNTGLAGSGGTITITNGGKITQFFPVGSIYNGAQGLGYDDAPLAVLNIGGGSDLSVTNSLEVDAFFIGRYWTTSGHGQVNIASNGLMRIRWNAHPVPRYNFTPNNDGFTDFWAKDGDIVTLNGGTIEMYQGSKMDLANFPSTTFNPATLRGNGLLTINSGGTTNWTLTNDGWIKPGDNDGTPSIGMLSMVGGDLDQTSTGGSFFDFDDGNLADLIEITDGVANLGGTNTFAGLGGYQPGLQDYNTWEFVRADQINYTASDNIATLMAGWGFAPEGYFFGVIQDGLQQVLILQIPEPSSLGLVAFGAGLWFLRRRKPRS